MSDFFIHLLRGLAYILPAYIANSSPIIVGGGKPLDLGKNFIDGRRIFGDNKTIRGLMGGIFFGTLCGFLLPFIFPPLGIPKLIFLQSIFLAFLLSVGTHIGDLLGSFIKRRLNLKPGAPAPILDQIGFIVFALLLAYPSYPLIQVSEIVIVIILTLIVHPLSNVIAYILGLKDKPW